MIKRILYLVIIVFASCTAKKNLAGTYVKNGKDFRHRLTLNQDSTFSLAYKYNEADNKCEGRWSYISKDTLLLQCNEVSVAEQISGSYISERQQKIIIITGKRINVGNVILKRQ